MANERRAERQAEAAERRASRAAERRAKGGAFREWLRERVLEARAAGLVGEEAFDHVLDLAVKAADGAINPPTPIGEAASDVAIRAARGLLGLLVQHAYDEVARAEGWDVSTPEPS
jgi:hypothetical protein